MRPRPARGARVTASGLARMTASGLARMTASGLAAVLVSLGPVAAAQQTPPPPPNPQRAPQTPLGAPAVRVGLSELAGLAGALGRGYYLNALCGDPDDPKWRGFIERMLDLEAGPDPDSPERLRLTGAFNAAYGEARAQYDQCDSRAEAQLAATEAEVFRRSDQVYRALTGLR